MLHELYRYALRNQLTARAGYRERTVKAYLSFASGGGIPALIPALKPTTLAPDLGSKANGTKMCNPLVEKASYVLAMADPADPKTKNNPVKHQFYLTMLEGAAQAEPRLAVCLAALSDEATLALLRQALAAAKLKPSDPIGLMVDMVAMESSEALYDWWDAYRATLGESAGVPMRCLITGKVAVPLATVPKVSGLRSVGGHTSGDALLCFDKDAFTSYGFDQSENACVSEEAMTAVNAALRRLIAQAPTLAGAKYVYFYKEPIAPEEDILPCTFGQFVRESDEDGEPDMDSAFLPDGAADGASDGEPEPEGEKDGDAEPEAGEAVNGDTPAESDPQTASLRPTYVQLSALKAARALLTSIEAGERPELLQNRYYIMPISGANGRMMVRGWMEGSFETLCRNTLRWYDDLLLVSQYGKGDMRAPKLFTLLLRLLKPLSDIRKLSERVNDELSPLTARIIQAIINDWPLPDAVATRALMHIRSKLMAAEGDGGKRDNKQERMLDPLACALLKAWLNRKKRVIEGATLMNKDLNPAYQGIAYHLGRLMAVYAAIQTEALKRDLGAGVLQRYYASASASPALVIGKLAQLSQHHLAKISNAGDTGTSVWFSKRLQEIYANIQEPIPTMLTLMQQSEFALGYYHQRAALFTKKAAEPQTQPDDADPDTETAEQE